MRSTLIVRTVLIWLILLTGCAATERATSRETVGAVSAGRAYLLADSALVDVHADVFALASAEMEGREAATRGEALAAEYIAERLRSEGVLPGGDLSGERGFLQEFDVRMTRFDTARTRLAAHDERIGRLDLGEDWTALPEFAPNIGMDTVGVVFSGFGITAIEQGYDDYAGIDAAGKIVVALGGAPAHLDSITTFGETFAPSDLITKWISAVIQGAAALVLVDFEPAVTSWDAFSMLARGRSLELADDDDPGVPVMPYLFLSESAGRTLMDAISGTTSSSFSEPRNTDLTMALHLATDHSMGRSRNVVGYVPGSTSPDEYVALGAHIDHLGMNEDGIFLGADDDASGVSAVLAAARAFARDAASGSGTDRSLLVVFHGAEEKGLLGAEFFTSNPERSVIQDLNQVVVQINLDMIGRESRDSLHVVGAGRLSSRLEEIVYEANADLGTDGRPLFALDRSLNDPDDPEKTFERSDHFKYAVRGIPVVFLTDGMGSNWAKGSETDDYHRVTDEPEKVDLEKVRRVSTLAYEIARRLADAETVVIVDGAIPIDTR